VKIPLDHVGYTGPDIGRLAAAFRTLGFIVTGPEVLHTSSSSPLASNAVQRSAHVLFDETYIELTSVDPCPADHHLAPFQGPESAIRLLVLATGNARQRAEMLSRAGLPSSGVSEASRRLDYGECGTARFRWFSLKGQPIPHTLTACVEHRTREAVFHDEVRGHPNTISRILALHHRPGSVPVALRQGSGPKIELRESEAASSNAFFTGLTLQAEDLQTCTRIMRDNGVSCVVEPGRLKVPASEAAGAFLVIEQSP
jgi:hypothetical protein